MADQTNISWADATLNFWVGCLEVSIGPKGACTNCYARTWANRFPQWRGTWGARAERRRTAKNLAKARKMQRIAIASGKPFFCFSNSLSDIFDNAVPIEWLREAFEIMRDTPEVTYLLLTKRPQNILKRFVEAHPEAANDNALADWWPRNVAIGCTAVTQAEANRDIPVLLAAKAALKPAFAFVSMEPLMEMVDLTKLRVKAPPGGEDDNWGMDALRGRLAAVIELGAGEWDLDGGGRRTPTLDWVITGGESGAHARPSHPDWFRSLRDQCAAAGVAFHHKQNGEWLELEVARDIIGDDDPRISDSQDRQRRKSPLTYQHDATFVRVGTDDAGRVLDEAVHDARPEVREAA